MIIKRRLILILITLPILLIFLTGCINSNDDPEEEYTGEKLLIGVIGDIPEIRESQVEFQEVGFDYLKEENFPSQYDAIFITKENLSEASNPGYAPIYKTSNIPFYFIENEKSYVNFVDEDLAYEDEPDSNEGMYLTGVLYIKNKTWGYGLYNDTNSKTNINGVYSRVFKDISEIKNGQLP